MPISTLTSHLFKVSTRTDLSVMEENAGIAHSIQMTSVHSCPAGLSVWQPGSGAALGLARGEDHEEPLNSYSLCKFRTLYSDVEVLFMSCTWLISWSKGFYTVATKARYHIKPYLPMCSINLTRLALFAVPPEADWWITGVDFQRANNQSLIESVSEHAFPQLASANVRQLIIALSVHLYNRWKCWTKVQPCGEAAWKKAWPAPLHLHLQRPPFVWIASP